MDDLDLRIIEKLKENARLTHIDLSEQLHCPRTTIAERIRQLERRGTIRGYTVRLNHFDLNQGITTFVLLQAGRNPLPYSKNLAERVASLPEVEEAYVITGDWDILAKVRVDSLEGQYRFTERLVAEPGVVRTHTIVCTRACKEPV